MPIDPKQTCYYKRARFTTRLPINRIYDPGHFWLEEIEKNLYRVGFTKFATRMLGDLVEINFDVTQNDAVSIGQVIGSIEGFKAISDIYNSVGGVITQTNGSLDRDPTLLDRDPYDAGWLYMARGTISSASLDLQGYIALLDTTVDQMLNHPSTEEQNHC
ncbi:Glycine cleavage system H protein [Novipirellula aureliae]|uniref:Glycine cleavage system H protein n=1 Tax=Novipirellula aureliae TaxID=2527966 RepID=A0A5C6EB53_9BACT|nr:glycine cleavage system protein H [Novipirellula aureliae]TWU45980.1 Glycine cleavage system H protein [Novipirellula aureliae]